MGKSWLGEKLKCEEKRWHKTIAKAHRNSARNMSSKENASGASRSGLIVNSLRRHVNLTNNSNYLSRVTSASVADGADMRSTCDGLTKTFNAFASDWTCLMNIPTFSKLATSNLVGGNRSCIDSHLMLNEILAVHAAVSGVIDDRSGEKYFAALMTKLDGLGETRHDTGTLDAVLLLVGLAIRNLPQEVIKEKFGSISKVFLNYLKCYDTSQYNTILKLLVGCSSMLLRMQDRAVWNDPSTFLLFDALLKCTIHSLSEVREASRHGILAILKGSYFCKEKNVSRHPATKHTAERCNRVLRDNKITEDGLTVITHMLSLLEGIISIFPESELAECCNTIFSLIRAGEPMLKFLGLQTLHGLFSANPSISCCPATLNAIIINALYDDQPSFVDVQLSLAWFAAMQEAITNLARNDLELAVSNLPKFFKDCSSALLSTERKVIDYAASCLIAVLQDCLGPAATVEHVQAHMDSIRKVYEILNHFMKNQYYNAAWKQILPLIGTLFVVCGKTCPFMVDCLKPLAALRGTNDIDLRNAVDRVFCLAIQRIGPEAIVNKFPVQVIEYEQGPVKYGVKYSWLLPFLQNYTYRPKMAIFFKNENLFPKAMACRINSENLGKAGNEAGQGTYGLLQSQIWSLLPSFCNEAQDIRESFPEFASLMMTMLAKSDLSKIIMSALRKLVRGSSQEEQTKAVMIRYAENCIVALFNVYVDSKDESVMIDAENTIKEYLSICNDAVYESVYAVLLQKLDSEEAREDEKKCRFQDLMRFMSTFSHSKPFT